MNDNLATERKIEINDRLTGKLRTEYQDAIQELDKLKNHVSGWLENDIFFFIIT